MAGHKKPQSTPPLISGGSNMTQGKHPEHERRGGGHGDDASPRRLGGRLDFIRDRSVVGHCHETRERERVAVDAEA